MDVIALAQNGVSNAVATLGTATTTGDHGTLLRQVDRIVFCFRRRRSRAQRPPGARWKIAGSARDNKRLGFVFLPQGTIPTVSSAPRAADEFDRLVKPAMPLSDFLLANSPSAAT